MLHGHIQMLKRLDMLGAIYRIMTVIITVIVTDIIGLPLMDMQCKNNNGAKWLK